jgi:hypothetical protein
MDEVGACRMPSIELSKKTRFCYSAILKYYEPHAAVGLNFFPSFGGTPHD